MIVTIYNTDGTKKRIPVGYGGGVCHAATLPYEKREVPGSVKKSPTPEAYEDPENVVSVAQQAKVK